MLIDAVAPGALRQVYGVRKEKDEDLTAFGRALPRMGSVWGWDSIAVTDLSGYVIRVSDCNGATGLNFDNMGLPLKNGENGIALTVSGEAEQLFWGGDKMFKLEVNDVVCPPKDLQYSAGDNYIKLPDERVHLVEFELPPGVISSGRIDKMQIVVGAGRRIWLEVFQPRLIVIDTKGQVVSSPATSRGVSTIALGEASVPSGENMSLFLKHIWGVPRGYIFNIDIETGLIHIKGSHISCVGTHFDDQRFAIRAGSKLLVDLEIMGPTELSDWIWGGAVLKVDVNNNPLKPQAEMFKTDNPQDPYLKPFVGRKIAEYSLDGISEITRIGFTIGAGNNIDMIIRSVNII